MRPIQLIILLVAFGAAGLAGLLATRLMSTPQVEEVQVVQPTIQTAEVLVVTRDVPMGVKVPADALAWRAWPAEGLSDQYITRAARPEAITELAGKLTRSAMSTGEPLKEAKLITDGSSYLAGVLTKGMRAVAVRVNAASTAGGFILPEDRVDIILVRTGANNAVSSETIMTNVRVLALDQNMGQNAADATSSFVAQNTATLELAPDQAELVTQAQQVGTISLSLRSITEDDSEPQKRAKPTGVNWVKFGVPSR